MMGLSARRGMTRMDRIKGQIMEPSCAGRDALHAWLAVWCLDDECDRQIKRDSLEGRLDRMTERFGGDCELDRYTELPEAEDD